MYVCMYVCVCFFRLSSQRKKDEEAAAAVANYEAQREQRAEERKTMLEYLRFCRISNMVGLLRHLPF